MRKSIKDRINEIFKVLNEYLIQKENGSYIFKNHITSLTLSRHWDRELDPDPFEEICQRFEKEILSKIPHAILIFKDKLTFKVNIGRDNKYLRKINLMRKEIDIYESIKTLFFPTMKERLIKIGNSNPEWLYFPSKSGVKNFTKENSTSLKGDIRFIKNGGWIMRGIDGAAIDFLKEDIEKYIEEYKFRNPFPILTETLPPKDITLEEIKSKPRKGKKGIYSTEFYSFGQKIKYIKELLKNFFPYYKKLIVENFFLIRNLFFLYSHLPLKMTVFIENRKLYDMEDVRFQCLFEELSQDSENQIEFKINQKGTFDPERHIYSCGDTFSDLISPYKNPLPFIYNQIKEELEDIIEKIENYTIFEDFKPFETPVESWVQMILDAEKKGNETYSLELKKIPTESPNGDGKGNDLYSSINSFENSEGGYIFIGIDEDKESIDKIVGLEGYFRDNNKNIDSVKKEIFDKCFKYLKRPYRTEANIYNGKTIIRIKINSNNNFTKQ